MSRVISKRHMPRFDLSDGVQLRVLEESDAEELYGIVDRNRAYLAEWLPWPATQTLEGTLEFIKKTRHQLEENDGFQTAMVLDGRIVGSVGFVGIRWDARATGIGYWVAEEQQGRGLMTRAVGDLTEHAFDELDLNRVEIQARSTRCRRSLPTGAAAGSRSGSGSRSRACCVTTNGWASAISTSSCTGCSRVNDGNEGCPAGGSVT